MRAFANLVGKEVRALFYSPIAYAVIAVFLLLMGYSFTLTLFINKYATLLHIFFQSAGLLFLLILFMVVRPLMVMLAESSSAVPVGETPALPASVGQVEAAISGRQPSQILDMAKSNPANTAVVVKQWLKSNA